MAWAPFPALRGPRPHGAPPRGGISALRVTVGGALLATVLLTGCEFPWIRTRQEARAKDFARLFVRVRLASRSLEGHPESARQARAAVLAAEGTNLAGYRQKLAALQADPERWTVFWERVRTMADSIEKAQLRKGT